MPVDEPIVATAGAVLDHVPPEGVVASVADAPTHTGVEPVIVAGCGFTVIVVVVEQPEPTV
jgi:hypothetical protein